MVHPLFDLPVENEEHQLYFPGNTNLVYLTLACKFILIPLIIIAQLYGNDLSGGKDTCLSQIFSKFKYNLYMTASKVSMCPLWRGSTIYYQDNLKQFPRSQYLIKKLYYQDKLYFKEFPRSTVSLTAREVPL